MFTVMRYPDAPKAEKGTTIETGNWFQDYARDVMERAWGVSPKAYASAEYQLTCGEGRFCEFKHDPHSKYGHLSIEVQERAQNAGRWCIAGPLRCQQPYYVQGDKESIWMFSTHFLISWLESKGIWVNWEDGEYALISDVIDERGILHEKFGTIRTTYLEYDEAQAIGGVEIKTNEL